MKRKDSYSPSFEEICLWSAYTAGVERIVSRKKEKPPKKADTEESGARGAPAFNRSEKKSVERKLPPFTPFVKKAVTGAVNPEYEKRLSRGEVNYDSRLDLHGMTADRAFTALVQFVTTARLDGQKILLIITGKGRPDPETGEKTGTLKSEVPVWAMSHPKLSAYIRKITPAAAKHGGEGAFYFILNK